jgi:hypothetical protein
MAQYAITYAPNYSGGAAPSNTATTGSFFIGNLSGSRAWNNDVPQSTTDTYFYGSPAAVNVQAYIFAIPNAKDAHGAGNPPVDQPHFFKSLNPATGAPALTDAAFIGTADFILKNYAVDGTVNPGSPANPAGCSSVSDCILKIGQASWFHSYSYVPAP